MVNNVRVVIVHMILSLAFLKFIYRLCLKSFFRSEIEYHAANCEGNVSSPEPNIPPPRYSSADYMSKSADYLHKPADLGQGVRNPGNGAESFVEDQLCPICCETYPPDIIERHAARCGEVYV